MTTQDTVHRAIDHDQLRLDDVRWKTLPFAGIQDCFGLREADDVIELRNCTCGSTLARYAKRSQVHDEISLDPARSIESL